MRARVPRMHCAYRVRCVIKMQQRTARYCHVATYAAVEKQARQIREGYRFLKTSIHYEYLENDTHITCTAIGTIFAL